VSDAPRAASAAGGLATSGNRQSRLVWLAGITSAALYGVAYLVERALGRAAVAAQPPGRSHQALELLLYWVVFAGLVAIYGLLLVHVRRRGLGRGALRLALAIPVLFHVCLWAARPYLSIDLMSYVAHGHIATSGGNPYLQPAESLAHTRFGDALASYGWQPVHGLSPYGPLWTDIEALVLHVTGHVRAAMLLLDLVVTVASLVSAWLVWVILGAVRPGARVLGTVAYLWNPVVLSELAGDGHNDAVLVVFVLASLALAVRGRELGSGLALVLGVLTKFVPLSLLPAYVVYTARSRRSHLVRLGLGVGVGVGAAALLYWPYWAGARTFDGVRDAGKPGGTPSTSGAIWDALSHVISHGAASVLTTAIVGAVFAAYVVRETAGARDDYALLRACAGIALAYVLIATPIYLAWYATLSIALMTLVLDGPVVPLLLVTTLCSRVVAPFNDLVDSGFLSNHEWLLATTAIGVWIPLAVLVLGSSGNRPRSWRRLASLA
jgi:alpha-1,6-mannosyltransferase